ncbi:MAG TPA: acyl-CoA dehydrogenase [bacterium (Candidatus Stahlbacteria)]|nr:acyl-CoA dehydrogenase [Candidatus Stahlbacteria bacterium]
MKNSDPRLHDLSEFTPKHIEFRDKVREFALRELFTNSFEVDCQGRFPLEKIKKIGELGWLGIPFPEEYGGLGLDTTSYIIAVEEISRVCASTGITLAAHVSLGCFPIFAHGTEEQKRRYLTPLLKGEKLGGFGLTEPNAGSDAGATETTAVLNGDYYIISGTKRFITSGSVAGTLVLTATEDRSLGIHGISAFIVDTSIEGFHPTKDEDKLGLKGSITSELAFEDCRIPKVNLLGEPKQGFKIFMETLDGGRISIGALALGIGQGILDVAIDYAQRRGLKKKQWVQKIVADIATEVKAARHLVYHAARLKDQGKKTTLEGAMAKLFASEVSIRAATKAIQIPGCEGVLKRLPLERFLRDTKLNEIGEGTSEIQRIVIAREILGR